MEGYTNNIPDPNLYLIPIQAHQWANAAELLRDYNGWDRDDFEKFKTWMKDTFYSVSDMFLKNHNGGQGLSLIHISIFKLLYPKSPLYLHRDQNRKR